jgi:DNA-binding Lrp family transcriptional regulator
MPVTLGRGPGVVKEGSSVFAAPRTASVRRAGRSTGFNIPGARYDRINQLLPEMPEVYHCLRVAGEDCYVLLIHATSVPHLDAVASKLATTGAVTTNVVYETVVDNRPVERPYERPG